MIKHAAFCLATASTLFPFGAIRDNANYLTITIRSPFDPISLINAVRVPASAAV